MWERNERAATQCLAHGSAFSADRIKYHKEEKTCCWQETERSSPGARRRPVSRAAEQHQNADSTPYEGMEVRGRARAVYVGGVLAARDVPRRSIT